MFISIEVIDGFLPLRETFKSRSIHHEEIDPSVIVIVEHGRTTSGCFEDISLVHPSCYMGG